MSKENETNATRIKKETFLKSLEKGTSISNACNAADINRVTAWRWRNGSKKFNEKVLVILDSRTQIIEDALFKAGLKGNVTALIFWLKNRSRDRWRDRYDQNVSGDLDIKIVSAVPRPENDKDSQS